MTRREGETNELLDDVLGQLDQTLESRQRKPAGRALRDGIDRQRGGLARTTRVRSVRRSRAAGRFRRELEEGSLTVGAAVGFLRLLRRVLQLL